MLQRLYAEGGKLLSRITLLAVADPDAEVRQWLARFGKLLRFQTGNAGEELLNAGVSVMEIDYETVCAFVRDKGKVSIVDTTGQVKPVTPDGRPDAREICEKADRFLFDAQWYTRREFEKLLDSWKEEKGNLPS